MLGVQNKCGIEALAVQLFRRLVVQHVQEVSGDADVICLGIDTHTINVKTVPVQQHGRQASEQPVGDIALIREVAFGLNVAEKRNAGTKYVHRVRVGRYHFKHCLQCIGQAPVGDDFCDIGIEFSLCREMTVQQQKCNLLEARVIRQVINVIAAIGEARALLADGA